MYFDLMGIIDFIKEHVGKILFLTGVMLLFVSLFLSRAFGSLESALTMFFGVTSVAFGMFIMLGMLSVKLRSLNGLGTIMICTAVVFFALSIASVQFLDVTVLGYVEMVFRGQRTGEYRAILQWQRPYAMASQIFLQISLASFVAGIALKIFNTIKYYLF